MTSVGDVEVRFGDEHQALRDRLDAFVARAIEPVAEKEEDNPDEAFEAYRILLGDEGLFGEMVTAPYGRGRDRLDLCSICLVREALAGASGLADLIFVMQGLGSFPIRHGGSEALKSAWLP